MFYQYSDIKTVHLEVTEACNAACPQCARNINGGEVNPYINNRQLYLSDITKIFSKDFLQQLQHIYLCGNFGDPIAATDTLEIFDYFRKSNPNLLLSMNTNGSARTTEWWKSLAHILGEHSYVTFSIDGLEDTNHLYRKNTSWERIIENVNAFISAGGSAHWEFIVFGHNEHQIEEARELANKLNFKHFQVKKSGRFFSQLSNVIKESTITTDKKGNEIVLEAPKNPLYRNIGMENINLPGVKVKLPTTVAEIQDRVNPELFNKNPSKKTIVEKLYDETPIKCKVLEERSVYISAEGIVQPCCWMAGQMYSWCYSPRGSQLWKLINKVGKDSLNALHVDLETIIHGEYFQNMISGSWTKPSCAEGKLAICAKTCGTKLETFTQQYS